MASLEHEAGLHPGAGEIVGVNDAMQKGGPSTHIPALDGVRGFAVLLIISLHLILFNDKTGTRIGDVLTVLHGLGWTGVDLFFVLSGFLITGILYDTRNDPNFFRNFYMRRILRIFPLYYGFLAFLLLMTPVLHTVWHGQQYVLIAYLQNVPIWFSFRQFSISRRVDLEHFWSLAVEEQFYLFWPLVVVTLRDRGTLIKVSLALSLLALALRTAFWFHGASVFTIFAFMPCRMDTLLLGGCLALVLRGNCDWIQHRWLVAMFLVSAALTVTYAIENAGLEMRTTFYGGTLSYSVIALGCTALLAMTLRPFSLAQRIFQWRLLRSLGKYSYGIYVLHLFVGQEFTLLVQRVSGTTLRNMFTPWLHSRTVALLLEFAIVAAVVYSAAWLSFNLYEIHFLRLKRFFPYRELQTERSEIVAAHG